MKTRRGRYPRSVSRVFDCTGTEAASDVGGSGASTTASACMCGVRTARKRARPSSYTRKTILDREFSGYAHLSDKDTGVLVGRSATFHFGMRGRIVRPLVSVVLLCVRRSLLPAVVQFGKELLTSGVLI